MDTAGLGGRSSGSREGWGTRAGAIWHVNKGSPIWENWALSLVGEGKGVSCRGAFSPGLWAQTSC